MSKFCATQQVKIKDDVFLFGGEVATVKQVLENKEYIIQVYSSKVKIDEENLEVVK